MEAADHARMSATSRPWVGLLMMLLGLTIGVVLALPFASVYAISTAGFALIPYAILAFVFARNTTEPDDASNIRRALLGVATPVFVLLFLLVGLWAPDALILYSLAGVPVLYGGSLIGAFLFTRKLASGGVNDQSSQ